MTRFACPFVLSVLVLISSGCRMCGSPYDSCTPAFLDRGDDYRGCDPQYRSGSIFSTGKGDCYLGSDVEMPVADRSMNAGNFGVTVPVDASKTVLGPRQGTGPMIGRPSTESLLDGTDFETPTKSVEEILRDTTVPVTPTPLEDGAFQVVPQTVPMEFPTNTPVGTPADTPVTPPVTLPLETLPVETLPEIQPFTMPRETEPVITVEDLRRLDPSVTDIKILDVEDAVDPGVGTRRSGTTVR